MHYVNGSTLAPPSASDGVQPRRPSFRVDDARHDHGNVARGRRVRRGWIRHLARAYRDRPPFNQGGSLFIDLPPGLNVVVMTMKEEEEAKKAEGQSPPL